MIKSSVAPCDAGQKLAEDKSSRMDVFPAFFKVRDREIIIVGGGDEAASKLRLVSETSAHFTVIAEETSEAMDRAIALSGATLVKRA